MFDLKATHRDSECISVTWKVDDQTLCKSPIYFVVEMAPFSKTFWDRYSEVWWFDRYLSWFFLCLFSLIANISISYATEVIYQL